MRKLLVLSVLVVSVAAVAGTMPGAARADFDTCTHDSVFCGWRDNSYSGTQWEWGTALTAMYTCHLDSWCYFADAPNDQLSSVYNNRSSANKYDTYLGKDRALGGGSARRCYAWAAPYDFSGGSFNDVASSIDLTSNPNLC
jgi:hypothetical protein